MGNDGAICTWCNHEVDKCSCTPNNNPKSDCSARKNDGVPSSSGMASGGPSADDIEAMVSKAASIVTDDIDDDSNITDSNKPKPQCGICHRPYANMSALKKHSVLVHGIMPETGGTSGKKPGRKKKTSARNAGKKKERYLCPLCHKTFGWKEPFQIHSLSAHGIALDANLQVKNKSKDQDTAKDNQTSGKGTKDKAAKRFLCPYCFRTFSRTEGLKFHTFTVHGTKLDTETANTSVSVSSSLPVITHNAVNTVGKDLAQSGDKQDDGGDSQGLNVCNICNKMFSTYRTLRKHYITVHGKVPVKATDKKANDGTPSNEENKEGQESGEGVIYVDENDLTCPFCLVSFPEAKPLKLHAFIGHGATVEVKKGVGQGTSGMGFVEVKKEIMSSSGEQDKNGSNNESSDGKKMDDQNVDVEGLEAENQSATMEDEEFRDLMAAVSKDEALCKFCYKVLSNGSSLRRHYITVHKYLPTPKTKKRWHKEEEEEGEIPSGISCEQTKIYVDRRQKFCPVCEKQFKSFETMKVHVALIHKAAIEVAKPNDLDGDHVIITVDEMKKVAQNDNEKANGTLNVSHNVSPGMRNSMANGNNKPKIPQRLHYKQKPLLKDQTVCFKCNRTFSTHACLRRHLIVVHYILPCDNVADEDNNTTGDAAAGQTTQNPGDSREAPLVPALKVRAPITSSLSKPLYCPVCYMIYEDVDELRTHCLSVHDHEYSEQEAKETTDIIYEKCRSPKICKICDKSFSRWAELKKHTFLVHRQKVSVRKATNDYRFKCDYCPKVFNRRFLKAQHERVHTGEKPFVCHICSNRYASNGNLKAHIKAHAEAGKWKCSICDKVFREERTLNLHIQAHLGHKPFKCEVCGKGFTEKRQLAVHRKTHESHKIQCDICGAVLASIEILKRHVARHGTQERLNCRVCNKVVRKAYMNEHMSLCHGEKTHKCEQCGKLFSKRYLLTQHMLKHTGERRHWCHICPRGFYNRQKLKTHLNIHFGVKPFKCEICGKCSSDRSNHIKHRKIHMKNW